MAATLGTWQKLHKAFPKDIPPPQFRDGGTIYVPQQITGDKNNVATGITGTVTQKNYDVAGNMEITKSVERLTVTEQFLLKELRAKENPDEVGKKIIIDLIQGKYA